MKNLANTLVTVIITFIVTLLLNLAVEYFAQDKGVVTIGPTTTVQGQVYVPVDISNFTGNTVTLHDTVE
jgi:hypothetical protein